jgi:hypothetical protein
MCNRSNQHRLDGAARSRVGHDWPIWVLLFWLAAWPALGAASLTASLDRNVIPLGESATLSLAFENTQLNGAPQLPEMNGLQVTSVAMRTEIATGTGTPVNRQVFNYTLEPTREGDFTIPAFKASIGGQVMASQELKLKVVKGKVPPAATAGPEPALVRLVVPKNEVYVGEPMPVEIHLYWLNAQNIQRPQLKAEGFSLSEYTPPAQSKTQLNGQVYNLAVFRLTARAAKTGPVALGPVEASLEALQPVNNGRRRSPFDDPFGFFGPQYRAVPMNLKSDPVKLTALPLPTDSGTGTFSGAIGQFRLTATAAPTNVAVGDPVTLKIQITGQGALDSLKLPEQPQWRGFKVYPAINRLETTDNLGLVGTMNFEQTVVPQNISLKEIPPLVFTYFDPVKRAYATLTGPRFDIIVRPSGGQTTIFNPTPTPEVSTNTVAASPSEIVHIKPHLGTLSPSGGGSAWSLGWLWFNLLPPGLLGLTLWWHQRAQARAADPRRRRRLEVRRLVQDGLQQMPGLAAAPEAEPFYALVFRLLQEQLGARLDLPASAITEAVLEERLRPSGFPPELLAMLGELFTACNQARYGGGLSRQDRAQIATKLTTTLASLEEAAR